MQLLSAIFVFVLGTIVGSFLNVVVLRYKTGRTVGGRSFCFSCGQTLRALELIPVLSFLIQGGKCRNCKTPISWQYLLVELLTGLMFLLVFVKTSSLPGFSASALLFFWLVFSLLIIIAVYDIKHKIVPDLVVAVFAISSLLWMLANHEMNYFGTLNGILDILSGPLFFLPFFLIWFISEGRWMGLGDGKLVIGFGWLLGIAEGASAIVLAFWIAAALSLTLMLVQRLSPKLFSGLSMKTEIPFAPFLVLGVVLSYCYSLDILSIEVLLSL